MRTPLVEKQIADQARVHGLPEEQVLEQVILAPHAVKRLIEPSEVADVVAFLAGPGRLGVHRRAGDDGPGLDRALGGGRGCGLARLGGWRLDRGVARLRFECASTCSISGGQCSASASWPMNRPRWPPLVTRRVTCSAGVAA